MQGLIYLNADSLLAMTITAPTAGGPGVGDDGKVLKILTRYAHANTITCTGKFMNANASVLTMSAAVGATVQIKAYNGYWYVMDAGTVSASMTNVAQDANGTVELGTYVSASTGSGNVLSSSHTSGMNVFADDGAAALTAVTEYKTLRSRLLITHAQSGNNTSFEGFMGSLKYCAVADTCTPAFRAGAKGYCESISGSTLGDKTAGLLGLIDLPVGATVAANCIVSAVCASSYNLGGTHTGNVVAYDVQTPFTAGAFDALLHAPVNAGVAGTTYGAIDANKCLIVLWESAAGVVTKMKIPLYAV
jgi:hypothetical protein